MTPSKPISWSLLATLIIALIALSSQSVRGLVVRALDQVASPHNSNSASLAGQGQTGNYLQAAVKPISLKDISFDVVRLNSTGAVTERRRGQAQYYTEELGAAVKVEMVKIPAGTFMMGISFKEAEVLSAELRRDPNKDRKLTHSGDQYIAMQLPQRPVTMQSFFMSKFEVTQAQWRAVAQLPKVNRELAADPSFFKGSDLPVEEVTWEDAMEFCARLSRATGREYRLPSEAEWEYACRAGTTTQFHFGDTITPEVENYNGDYSSGSGPQGINRERTVPVGSLVVTNAFGLYDMHGNVKEWCMDQWHENYNGAPWDGRVWTNQGGSSWLGCGQDYLVVRGGSWLQGPMSSADRSRLWWTNNKNYFTGFRLVCASGAL